MYSGEAGDRGGWDGEAPPLIIPVDLGGGDWLEQVIAAVGDRFHLKILNFQRKVCL